VVIVPSAVTAAATAVVPAAPEQLRRLATARMQLPRKEEHELSSKVKKI
jgi:hypothetical protein